MIFNALFVIYKRTFHVKDYVGQLLVHVYALLSCSVVILNVHNMLMCIIRTNKWWWWWTTYTYREPFRRRRNFWWENALNWRCIRLQWRHARVLVDAQQTHRSKCLSLQDSFVIEVFVTYHTMWHSFNWSKTIGIGLRLVHKCNSIIFKKNTFVLRRR